MARCTAPVYGHRTASGAANCPACRYRYGSRYSSYSRPSYSSYGASSYGSGNSGSYGSRSRSSSGGRSSSGRGSARPSWSRNSALLYTPREVRDLKPVRENFMERSAKPTLRDVFLCHAWNDRRTVAKELSDLLESKNVSVWFSEKDIPLGTPFMRQIDKGLANSKIGIVLVTLAFLQSLKNEGVADKELSALLARELLIPITHGTTYDALRDVSPLLGSRNGLSTEEDTMDEVAAKVAELADLSLAA